MHSIWIQNTEPVAPWRSVYSAAACAVKQWSLWLLQSEIPVLHTLEDVFAKTDTNRFPLKFWMSIPDLIRVHPVPEWSIGLLCRKLWQCCVINSRVMKAYKSKRMTLSNVVQWLKCYKSKKVMMLFNVTTRTSLSRCSVWCAARYARILFSSHGAWDWIGDCV